MKPTLGEVKATNTKATVSRQSMKTSMEATIQHFKTISAGLAVDAGAVYSAV